MTDTQTDALRAKMCSYMENALPPEIILTGTQGLAVVDNIKKAITDAGYAIVPRKPTEAMAAIGNNLAQICMIDEPCGKAAQHIWADMLDAAQEAECEHEWVTGTVPLPAKSFDVEICEKCGEVRSPEAAQEENDVG